MRFFPKKSQNSESPKPVSRNSRQREINEEIKEQLDTNYVPNNKGFSKVQLVTVASNASTNQVEADYTASGCKI